MMTDDEIEDLIQEAEVAVDAALARLKAASTVAKHNAALEAFAATQVRLQALFKAYPEYFCHTNQRPPKK